jgi:hypothetical protein
LHLYIFDFHSFSSYDESIEVKVELPAFSPGANSPASDEPDNDNFDKPEEPEDVKESSPKRLVKNSISKCLVAMCHPFCFYFLRFSYSTEYEAGYHRDSRDM